MGYTQALRFLQGWRLPIGGSGGGEFETLNTAVNSGITNDDQGLRTNWLAQRGGYWYGSFVDVGDRGRYWSSEQSSGSTAYNLNFLSTYIGTNNATNKRYGYPIRCVAV